MKITTTKCDRCGEVIEEHGFVSFDKLFSNLFTEFGVTERLTINKYSGGYDHTLDLCDKCNESLSRWLHNSMTENEPSPDSPRPIESKEASNDDL